MSPVFRSRSNKRDQILAVDLGSRLSKAVLVERKEAGYRLRGYALQDAPVTEGAPSPLVLSEHLRAIVQKLDAKTRQLTLVIGPSFSILRNLELPLLPVAEIRQMLKLNPKTYFHQDLPGYIFDCYLVPPPVSAKIEPSKSATQKYKVWVGAIKQQVLADLQTAIKSAGLVADQIALGLLGPVNAFELTEETKGAVALVDLGYTSSSVSLVCDGELCLNRVVEIGGHKITAGLAEAMNISYAEAEGIKVGMPSEVEMHLQPLISPLGRELRASIDFFEHQQDKPVSQVFVSGGAARSEFFIQNLQNDLMIPCRSWNPINGLELALTGQQMTEVDQFASQLTVAIGAATAAF